MAIQQRHERQAFLDGFVALLLAMTNKTTTSSRGAQRRGDPDTIRLKSKIFWIATSALRPPRKDEEAGLRRRRCLLAKTRGALCCHCEPAATRVRQSRKPQRRRHWSCGLLRRLRLLAKTRKGGVASSALRPPRNDRQGFVSSVKPPPGTQPPRRRYGRDPRLPWRPGPARPVRSPQPVHCRRGETLP